MALTKGDKAECKEIAREIIKEVLIGHIESCPHGKTLLANKWFLFGICTGSGIAGGIAGGSAALGLARVILGL